VSKNASGGGRPGGSDELRNAAQNIRGEVEKMGDQLEGGVGEHLESISPELKQTMDDLTNVVSGIADKAKGMIGGVLGGVAGSGEAGASDIASAAADAGQRLAGAAERGVAGAEGAVQSAAGWIESTAGDLVERGKAVGGTIAGAVTEAIDTPRGDGSDTGKEPRETLN
jgi:hypothetical protein